MRRILMTTLLGSLLFSPALAADTQAERETPPPMPEQGVDGDALEPEVTIVPRKQGGRVEEYRLNGRLYAVKVIPATGKPYFLVDGDGDGYLETHRDELETQIMIPGWVLMSW